jgi:hypothetical protein
LGDQPCEDGVNIQCAGKSSSPSSGVGVDARCIYIFRAMAEHSIKAECWIIFKDMTVLAGITNYVDHSVKEAIDILLHSNSFSKDPRFTVSHPWYLAISMLKQGGDYQNSSK